MLSWPWGGSSGAAGAPAIPRFSADASLRTVVSGTLRYLKRAGWREWEAAPWANIWIRAGRGGVDANLMVHQPCMGLRTLLQDASEATGPLRSPVGILSIGPAPTGLAEDLGTTGVYVIGPQDLPDLEERIRRTTKRVAEAREASLRRD